MQIFPRKLNLLPTVLAVAVFLGGAGVTGGLWYYASPANLQVGYAPEQPVPYSHRLHAGELGMDCRYCHANVERSAEAMIPPTQTCMGCHNVVRPESPALAPIRESFTTGESVEWVRVHKLPDHVFFDHSVHVAVGVGCASCHGRIDQMEVVRVDQPLSMGWCLDCHRNLDDTLENNIRPLDQITNMAWERDPSVEPQIASLHPPTHCSGCHR
jgi:hypothetical protein